MAHFLKLPNTLAAQIPAVMNAAAYLNLIVNLNHYASLKSNIYQRSVFAFEHFEKRRSDELKQFNFDEIKKIFDNQLNNGHKKQQQEQKLQRKLPTLSTARLKKNLDSLVLTSRSERDLDFVVFTFKKYFFIYSYDGNRDGN
jgi:hypothetical protein